MAQSLDSLRDLLLDLIATHRKVDGDRVRDLGPDDWARILSMARQHRLEPLLYWRLKREHADAPAPADIRQALADSFRVAARGALLKQNELADVSRILRCAGIPFIALKGAFLAYAVYPNSAMRPLRDLDLLVRPADALRAYQALLDGGCRRFPQYMRDPQAALEDKKHLPQLESRSGAVCVEVHPRLLGPGRTGFESVDEAGIWERHIERTAGTETLWYLSPTDLLLHLIFHAAYDHKLNNGPLTLSDLYYLIQQGQIDWPLFWRLAAEGGWTKGCLLLLKMAERYYGDLPITYPPTPSSERADLDALVLNAAALTLRDFSEERDLTLLGAMGETSLRQRTRALLQRWSLHRTEIAKRHPGHASSAAVYAAYAVKAVRFAFTRVPQFLASSKSDTFRRDARRMAELDRWLVQR
jgi:Uncharacterised nucleotidyltransferase